MTAPDILDSKPIRRIRRRFAHMPWATVIELAARGGYLAYGAVYLSMGAIAVLAAAGVAPQAESPVGALEAWGDWPPGIALLWLAGLGLFALAGWRTLQSVFDVDRLGRGLSALCARAGLAFSGLAALGLGVSVFFILDAIEDLKELDDQVQTREAVARALDLPGGELIVSLVGLTILGVGVGNMIRAFSDHFGRTLACDADTARVAGWLGRIGHFARGLAMIPAGAFIVYAGVSARAGEARSLGGALQELRDLPLGPLALALIGAGLAAFGAFSVMEGCKRPIRPERAIQA
ncbi:DUF1206 domain-containing protein [Phenylobacterium sp. J367]|uniref:DUF1206 domain-containing protein n=1 Tax=Phenylobacterium sp. J367 TaxID=2898435 RepID=UPI002151AE52|nr:DUF1206 domain-containing protein [Phenylobacterium sp. J367]MCR5878287.1 DUF1206 domain-containing protein [Phenylobacterium sp. J367]